MGIHRPPLVLWSFFSFPASSCSIAMQSNINSVHLNMHIDAASTWDPLFGAFAMQLNRFDGRRIRLAERKEKHSHSSASL